MSVKPNKKKTPKTEHKITTFKLVLKNLGAYSPSRTALLFRLKLKDKKEKGRAALNEDARH